MTMTEPAGENAAVAGPCEYCDDGSAHDWSDCPTMMSAHGGEATFWSEAEGPDDETMVDLGGGMVVPLSEVMGDDEEGS